MTGGRRYYSNGKILLSAEYLVLYGARALALPTRFGQSLELYEMPDPPASGESELKWESRVMGKAWFSASFGQKNFEVRQSNDPEIAGRLKKILGAARVLNPAFLRVMQDHLVITDINFNRLWGLGTSSSLISNIAYWAGVDPFLLHRKVSRGSGFDIACARSSEPVIFRSTPEGPQSCPARFCPPFRDALYFVYLGHKKDSEDSVTDFLRKNPPSLRLVNKIDSLTMKMLEADRLDIFNNILEEHENLLSGLLGQPSLKDNLFRGFRGGVKSLGAWGGDFILVTWDGSYSGLEKTLKERKLHTVLRFEEMVLTSQAATT